MLCVGPFQTKNYDFKEKSLHGVIIITENSSITINATHDTMTGVIKTISININAIDGCTVSG